MRPNRILAEGRLVLGPGAVYLDGVLEAIDPRRRRGLVVVKKLVGAYGL